MNDNENAVVESDDSVGLDSAQPTDTKKRRGPRTMKQPPKSYFKDCLDKAQFLLSKNLVNLPVADAEEVTEFLKATGYAVSTDSASEEA